MPKFKGKNMQKVVLKPLENSDKEQFIKDNQEAFLYGATIEFGLRDEHYEEDGEIISRETIENSLKGGTAYRIFFENKKVGGVVLKIDKQAKFGELELLFTSPNFHSKGIGKKAWQEIEKMHPEIKIWQTCTPYFEKRNIHFYLHSCGFKIIEFYNKFNKDPNFKAEFDENGNEICHEMFLFEKIIL